MPQRTSSFTVYRHTHIVLFQTVTFLTLVLLYKGRLYGGVYQAFWQVPEVLFEQAGHCTHIRLNQEVHVLTVLQPLFQPLHRPHITVDPEQTLMMKSWGWREKREGRDDGGMWRMGNDGRWREG